jgi:hypothetical protein
MHTVFLGRITIYMYNVVGIFCVPVFTKFVTCSRKKYTKNTTAENIFLDMSRLGREPNVRVVTCNYRI